ncbi:hypothetical protein [Anaeromyxobacter oryzae]|uniref:Uncharacterized protein n=1 Tax=Anaeromyxobacter oryzae TaxID=2918170 RepID=A0ABM7WR66_9BACT|nr:hypothetical protein [Anaeromyxobacter oryzae]BDG01949.1 hypothetical protein AMOR_09450 [Anaeromyxobacter oryzae]
MIQTIDIELVRRHTRPDASYDEAVEALDHPENASTEALLHHRHALEMTIARTDQETAVQAARESARWTMIAGIATALATFAALVTTILAVVHR